MNHNDTAKFYAEKGAAYLPNLTEMLAQIANADTTDIEAFATLVAQTRSVAYYVAYELDAAVRNANTAKSLADLAAAIA